jgi:hypothetical protein
MLELGDNDLELEGLGDIEADTELDADGEMEADTELDGLTDELGERLTDDDGDDPPASHDEKARPLPLL